MLSTNHKARIHIEPKGMMYQSIEAFIQASQAYKSYHLYILSDDKTKKDDWMICDSIHNPDGTPYYNLHNDFGVAYDCCKKVIATTDTALLIPCLINDNDFNNDININKYRPS